jgi:hypothetical protein
VALFFAAVALRCQHADELSWRGQSTHTPRLSSNFGHVIEAAASLSADGLALAELSRTAKAIDPKVPVAPPRLVGLLTATFGDTLASRDIDGESVEPEEEAVIVSIARETWIHGAPRWSSTKLGYLRAGTIIHRASQPDGHRRCRGGWYRIVPRGYVCVGMSASIARTHPVAQLSARRPRRDGLPFDYVATRYPTPPLYLRLPTPQQQEDTEPNHAYHARRHRKLARDASFVPLPRVDPIPPGLEDNVLIPGLGAERRGHGQIIDGHAGMRSAFALLGSYEHHGRRFGLTTNLTIIPLDRTRVIKQSAFRGVQLKGDMRLPLGFVRSTIAKKYSWHEAAKRFRIDGRIAKWKAASLTGKFKRSRGHKYLQTRHGYWLRSDRIQRLEGVPDPPHWATRGDRWIDVSIIAQSLVAYRGETPIYATLVSTGKDGLDDPKETHATVQGTFLIHTKHVSVTMDGDEEGDEFDLRDVPFVQYFKDGYALHAAYWHEDFGRPRSHGCVNLSPLDAAWLFGFTDPPVPNGWHAALSLRKGTLVRVRP